MPTSRPRGHCHTAPKRDMGERRAWGREWRRWGPAPAGSRPSGAPRSRWPYVARLACGRQQRFPPACGDDLDQLRQRDGAAADVTDGDGAGHGASGLPGGANRMLANCTARGQTRLFPARTNRVMRSPKNRISGTLGLLWRGKTERCGPLSGRPQISARAVFANRSGGPAGSTTSRGTCSVYLSATLFRQHAAAAAA